MTTHDQPVLIIGAGINGAALARELVLNNVPVVLVDKADVASGTSAYSSRLIHGGLRYLEYGEFDLVREALAERARLLRLAPHLVRPLRLFIPVQGRIGGFLQAGLRFMGWEGGSSKPTPRGHWVVNAGLRMYDSYARDKTLPRHASHSLSDDGVPAVNADAYSGVSSYWDAQVPWAERLVVELIADAQAYAAENRLWFKLRTYHQVRLAGTEAIVEPIGEKSGEPLRFTPSAVVNATGAWVDHTLTNLGIDSQRMMGGTKGSHLVTNQEVLRQAIGDVGIYAEAEDGRPVFILPLGDATLIGTTDIHFEGDPATAVSDEEERDYLIRAINFVFPQVGISADDVAWHYCGVRPLPYVKAGSTASVTRRHRIHQHTNAPLPFYSLIGGKLTTFRALAAETTHALLQMWKETPTHLSQERPFPGAVDYPETTEGVDQAIEQLARDLAVAPSSVRACWRLLGTACDPILRQCHADPKSFGQPSELLADSELPVAVVRWVIREEWVEHLGDLVERRLMLLHESRLSLRMIRHLAKLMSVEGRLEQKDEAAAVEQCVTRLRDHFGRRA